MYEYVFGIRPYAQDNKIIWYVNRTERHGIERYPLGNNTVDLICEKRADINEKPRITVKSDVRITVEVHWGDGNTEIINS